MRLLEKTLSPHPIAGFFREKARPRSVPPTLEQLDDLAFPEPFGNLVRTLCCDPIHSMIFCVMLPNIGEFLPDFRSSLVYAKIM